MELKQKPHKIMRMNMFAGGAVHRKYKRPKLGGAHYEPSGEYTAALA
jgi:hypothetical protein